MRAEVTKINKIFPVCLVIISLFLSSGFPISSEAKFDVKHTQLMEKILNVVERLISNFMDVTVDIKPSLESLSAQIYFEYRYNNMIYPVQDQNMDFALEISSESDQIPLSDFPELGPLADEFVLYIDEVLFLPSGYIWPRDGNQPPDLDCIKTEILSIQDSGLAFNKSALVGHSFGIPMPDGPYDVKVQDKDGNLLYENTSDVPTFQYPITGLNSTAIVTDPFGNILAIGLLDVGTDAVGDWANIKAETNISCEQPPSVIEAEINIDPDTLNLKSKGKWITVYIEFPMEVEKGYLANIIVEYYQGQCENQSEYYIIEKGETVTSPCGYDITLLEVGVVTTSEGTKYVGIFEITDGVETETGAIDEGNTAYFMQSNVSITLVNVSEFGTETGEDVMTIDVNTVTLNYNNQSIPAENNLKYGFVKDPQPQDTDEDGIPEFMVKFERKAVQEMLASVSGFVELTVKGEFEGGEFEGSDIIRVI